MEGDRIVLEGSIERNLSSDDLRAATSLFQRLVAYLDGGRTAD